MSLQTCLYRLTKDTKSIMPLRLQYRPFEFKASSFPEIYLMDKGFFFPYVVFEVLFFKVDNTSPPQAFTDILVSELHL